MMGAPRDQRQPLHPPALGGLRRLLRLFLDGHARLLLLGFGSDQRQASYPAPIRLRPLPRSARARLGRSAARRRRRSRILFGSTKSHGFSQILLPCTRVLRCRRAGYSPSNPVQLNYEDTALLALRHVLLFVDPASRCCCIPCSRCDGDDVPDRGIEARRVRTQFSAATIAPHSPHGPALPRLARAFGGDS